MTCKCGLPALPHSRRGLCNACTKAENARVARERQAAYHRDRMKSKYGTEKTPPRTPLQKAAKEAIVPPKMPPKFIGVPVEHPPETLPFTGPVVRISLPDFRRIDPEEYDPAKAKFIDSIRR